MISTQIFHKPQIFGWSFDLCLETERSLKTRFLEHRRPSSTSSEVSQHIHIESRGHHVDLNQVKILDREPRFFERGVKEAIYIESTSHHSTRTRPIQATQSVWPDFGVTCQKGHWLLIWVASLQTKVEGSTKNSRFVKILCWDHKLKSQIYDVSDVVSSGTLQLYSVCKCMYNEDTNCVV